MQQIQKDRKRMSGHVHTCIAKAHRCHLVHLVNAWLCLFRHLVELSDKTSECSEAILAVHRNIFLLVLCHLINSSDQPL